MVQKQTHPLYLVDREHLTRLLAKRSPQDQDLIDLARLIIRYEGFPGAEDLQADLSRIMNLWELDNETLNKKTKEIWQRGFRPTNTNEDDIGSGFDTSDSS